MDLTWHHINNFQKSELSPSHLDIAGILDERVHQMLHELPRESCKHDAVVNYFDQRFECYDWARSFQRPQIIYYADALRTEILVGLQRYLRTRCADINNVYLVVSQNPGSDKWWQQWCELHHQSGYHVVNWTPNHSFWLKNFYSSYQHDIDAFCDQKIKNLNQHSSLFLTLGGSASRADRCYLVLRASVLHDCACIDFMGEFISRQALIDYVEDITGFRQQIEVDIIDDLYSRYVRGGRFISSYDTINLPSIHAEIIDFQGIGWQLAEDCYFQLIRETVNDECFASFTEKTLRCFAHFCLPLPVTFNLVAELRRLDFWLPDDIIDYSYQTDTSYHRRVISAINQLQTWADRRQELAIYMAKHRRELIHNSQRALALLAPLSES